MAEEVLTGPYRRGVSSSSEACLPSTEEGPFTVEQAVADVEAVLDDLGWSRVLAGRPLAGAGTSRSTWPCPCPSVSPASWRSTRSARVGDGGAATFGAELLRRVRG